MKKTIITAILATIILTGLGGNLRAQAVASLADDTIALGDQTTLSIRNALNYPSAEMLTDGGIVALLADTVCGRCRSGYCRYGAARHHAA